jgi:hypothetical protein
VSGCVAAGGGGGEAAPVTAAYSASHPTTSHSLYYGTAPASGLLRQPSAATTSETSTARLAMNNFRFLSREHVVLSPKDPLRLEGEARPLHSPHILTLLPTCANDIFRTFFLFFL